MAISAATGEGFVDLYDAIRPIVDQASDRIRTAAGLGPLVKRERGGSKRSSAEVVPDSQAAPEASEAAPSSQGADDPEGSEQEDGLSSSPIRMSIIGLTNVGKSTLMNNLLNHQRSLTGPVCSLEPLKINL